MCRMIVAYDEEHGGETIMENVLELRIDDNVIRLAGLLDDPIAINDVQVSRIDFRHGRTYLIRKAAR